MMCATRVRSLVVLGLTVEVGVSRDGSQLGGATFTPSYQSSQPNGPGCGAACYGLPAATLALQP